MVNLKTLDENYAQTNGAIILIRDLEYAVKVGREVEKITRPDLPLYEINAFCFKYALSKTVESALWEMPIGGSKFILDEVLAINVMKVSEHCVVAELLEPNLLFNCDFADTGEEDKEEETQFLPC